VLPATNPGNIKERRQSRRRGSERRAREGATGPLAERGPDWLREQSRDAPNRARSRASTIITKLFKWYATGGYSPKALTAKATAAALTNRASGNLLPRAQGESESRLRRSKRRRDQVGERIWLVTFMQYDLGYFDDETCRLEPIENPFGPKVLPMSPE